MKRMYRLPDGSEETVEGSPEELVEYERIRKLNETPKTKEAPVLKRKKEILKGAPEAPQLSPELFEMFRKMLEEQAAKSPSPFPPLDVRPVCWSCGRQGCYGGHSCPNRITPWPQPTVIFGSSTSDGTAGFSWGDDYEMDLPVG